MTRRVDIGGSFDARARRSLSLPADVSGLVMPVSDVVAVHVLSAGGAGDEVTVTNDDTGASAAVGAETTGRKTLDVGFEYGESASVTIDSGSAIVVEYELETVAPSS